MVSDSRMRENLGRHAISQALMGSFVVIEEKIDLQTPLQCRDRGVFPEIDFFIFDTAPQPFDEDIVETPTLAIHADPDVGVLQATGESQRRELRSLVGLKISGVLTCSAWCNACRQKSGSSVLDSCQDTT